MKKNVSEECFEKAIFLLQPTRPILCTTKNEDGSDHVAPFSWINPVSMKPPRLSLALLNKPKKQHSLENIERTGEFVVNMADMQLADRLVLASYWPNFGENKFDRSGFTRLNSRKVAPPAIAECRAHLECKVIEILTPGDHSLILADIVEAYYDSDAFNDNLLINMQNYKPMIHVQNYILPQSQLHVFMEPGGEYVSEVLFPTEEECKMMGWLKNK
jgi:flavin reductase (DIM6/NTAB) family NADH-FMN oxidoreductase RutF